ncbi:MAG: diguanylate cyclase, partial [Trichlorobacter sp.]|uniref:sensor domain-containing diguanylate cyclase n=1 Tax=Trichlorobacter sp. TaxID=2911007 RepID=UPI00256D84AD
RYTMNQADPSELLELAIKNIRELLTANSVQPEPPDCLAGVNGYTQMYATIYEIRTALLAFSAGDLGCQARQKGVVPGSIKALQAALRHLTWQTKMIASGDFSQRVDFMGEFSEAFNSMVLQLDDSMRKLELMAHVDPLTGTNNRGYFMELLSFEFERAKRYGSVFSVLMLDLDHFKAVNDTRGHAAGDEALRTLSRVLGTSELRTTDFFGRIGGEEFALVMPETDLQGAVEVAERVRSNLEQTAVVHNSEEFFITASIGVSQYRAGDLQDTLLSRADKAMYQAKEGGRNRVCREDLTGIPEHH